MEELGFGTLGSVFLAKWKGLLVAVKKMHALKGPGMKAYTDGNRKEILGEAEMMSLIRHPHIVDFYGISHEPEDDIFYLVLKREEGDLRKRIKGILKGEKQTLTLEDKLRISICICSALLYLQSKGIVHRDLRPGNILLCWYFENGRRVLGAKICDFGLTRIVDVMTNMSKGVPFFIAPENRLHEQKKPTFESDIFSLGMTLWCIFNLNLPDFLGPEEHCFKTNYDESVEGILMEMVKKCCAKGPQNRCKIEEVIAILEPLLEKEKTKNEKLKIEEEEKERVRRKVIEEKLELLEARELTRQVEVEEAKRKKIEVEARLKLLDEELEKKVQEFEVERNELNTVWRRRLGDIREAKRKAEARADEAMERSTERVGDLEKEVGELRAEKAKVVEEVKMLKSTRSCGEECGARVRGIEAERIALSAQVEELKTQNEALQVKLEMEPTLLPNHSAVEEEPTIEVLRKKIEVLRKKIEELQTKKKRLEMLETAHSYLYGLNEERVDYYKPHRLYEEIVNSGGKLDANANYNLGYMYDYGYGVKKDETKAKKFYKKATEFYSSKKVDDLKPIDWRNMGCMYLNGNANYNLGRMYLKGYGVKRDKTKAREFYKNAAKFYSSKKVDDLKPIDWANMGEMYVDGWGFEENQKKGIELLRKAVERANVLAMWNLGYCYKKGYGIEESNSEAFKLYSKAAEMGLSLAMVNLGFMYEKGYGVKKDKKKAFELYREAAEKGLREAMYNVGLYYKNGRGGVEKNLEEAKRWYKRAAELGYENARKKLEELEKISPSKSEGEEEGGGRGGFLGWVRKLGRK